MAQLTSTPWLQVPASTSLARTTQFAPALTTPPMPNQELRRRAGTNALDGYSYLGCVFDNTTRLLTATVSTYELNDPAFCCDLCLHINTEYRYCGLEASFYCFCDVNTAWALTPLSPESCNLQCPGIGSSSCGGHWAMDLYSATSAVVSSTSSGSSGTFSSTSLSTSSSMSSPSPTKSLTPEPGPSRLSDKAIIGIVIGIVAVLLLATVWFRQRQLARIFRLVRSARAGPSHDQQPVEIESGKPVLIPSHPSEMPAASPLIELEAWSGSPPPYHNQRLT
ncbi:MAG: hypothetical protein STHCBS139747_006500 [Sporothrix thermara]